MSLLPIPNTNQYYNYIKSFPFVCLLGDFTEIVNVCCEVGTNWASNNDRCDDFSGEITQINPKDQLLCHQVIKVCCIKSKQDQMCTKGNILNLTIFLFLLLRDTD